MTSKFEPLNGKKILFIGQDLEALGGVNQGDNGYLDQEDLPAPAGITTYASSDNLSLTQKKELGGEAHHLSKQLESEKFKGMHVAIGYNLDKGLEPILAGEIDAKFKELAEYFKAHSDRRFFFRFGYEFDFMDFDQTKYVETFRYFVNFMRNENVINVAYVWQAARGNDEKVLGWFPGAEYVDWLAYSHFHRDGDTDITPGSTILGLAEEMNKPVMIAECCANNVNLSATEESETAIYWFKRFLKHVNDHPRIKAISYINSNWMSKPFWTDMQPEDVTEFWRNTDSRIQRNQVIKALWNTEMANGNWILQGHQ